MIWIIEYAYLHFAKMIELFGDGRVFIVVAYTDMPIGKPSILFLAVGLAVISYVLYIHIQK